ncbi:MAG: phosphoenolpyruvate--protein phosphotransferase [Spirochaetaceae bacterium]|jgi:phosphotransferase system enzyme I (PtsI)|nr:phosphoenolpyruvate--protein phosphotransferase [Spirochaetaceae bacterium]
MRRLSGIPVSKGVAFGKALLYLEDALPEIPCYNIKKSRIKSEWNRFLSAKAEITARIREKLKEKRVNDCKEQRDILEAQLFMFEDVDFHENTRNELENKLLNIEQVVWNVSQDIIKKLSMLPGEGFRERIADVSGMAQELLHKLLSVKQFSLADLNEAVIVAARDLLPSQALVMNRDFVKAIVTDAGSNISHTAIIARASEIPAVMGLSSASAQIKSGDMLIVDGNEGLVFVEPDEETLTLYQKIIKGEHAKLKTIKALSGQKAETRDGRRITLKVNMETPSDLKKAIDYGAEGVGLYRSEFLFLAEGRAADEESQYQAYSGMLKAAKELPVTIRTLDAGGDKIIPDLFQDSGEKNPLLGWRSIRFSLSMPDIFKTQLRAILRASVHGNVRVMFPLISGFAELEQALKIWEEAKAECSAKKQAYKDNIPVGIMIEVPSAALVADKLIKRADFFSIGTNDLIQYTLGVDRGNERVSYLAEPRHPAILHLIKMTVDAAHKHGKPAAMCGEMAGDVKLTPLLLGLGLDEFSMNSAAIPDVKRIIRETSFSECQKLARQALRCTGPEDVAVLLKKREAL